MSGFTPAALGHRIDGPGDPDGPDGPDGAEPLVLLGSLGSDHTMWEPQYTGLADEFRVISVDLRGHGDSDVPDGPYAIADLAGDVLALIDAVTHPGQSVHLAGLSLGGVVAQWIAAHRPERLRSLTVLCTSARFGEPQDWHSRAAAVRAEGTQSLADAVVGRWFTPAFAAHDGSLVARSRAMVASTPDEGYAACCEALAEWDGHADLHRTTAPTLVIAGAQDPSTPPDSLRAIADGVRGSELHVLDPGAHLVNAEQPDTVNALLRAHIRAAVRTPDGGRA